ncbi:MAG: hypothetical protein B7X95_05090 [Methylophilaceae bacterium 17-44-8]|nr:MAG: hypothetical protein B7X95_05090 [Methylophilaceae bacterium 17-44-8]
MSLINRSIPNLYNGVSQQPPSLRLTSQATEQENGLSSVVYGLSKRPPTSHVAKLNTSTLEDSFVHTINRDANEQYKVIITNGGLKVYTLAGVERTVTFPDGTAYLNATDPSESFACVTVADYTFIVNKNVLVASAATTATGTFKGAKQQFVDLPTSGNVVNDVWEIAGTGTNSFDNYYVKWDGSGTWRETVKPGLKTTINAATMPFRLVNNGDGTFTCSKNVWATRLVGDDISAAFPSFVGNTIGDVFFHRNRLGFIASENVIFSRAGSFFNFFPETVTLVLDTDPVDVAVSHTKVAVLRHALAFNTSLMLFADQAQFQLTAKDILSPKTAVINVTTEFDIEAKAKPASSGTSIFFGVTKGSYSGIKEYLVQPLTYTNDASDLTAHVPRYIPKNLFKLASSNLDNVVIALSKDERNAMYVYRYYWSSPEEKVQSAWSKFTLDAGAVILDVDFINTILYIVVKRSDGTYLESLNLEDINDGELGVRVLLDQKILSTGVYDAGNNWTTWTTPYPVTSSFKAVLGETFTGQRATVLNPSAPSAYTLRVPGNYSSGGVYLGRPYTFRFTFSPVIFKDEQKISVVHYKVKLKNFEVLFDRTGYFRAEVKPDGRGDYKYTYTGNTLGDTSLKLGDVTLGTGKFRFPIMGDSSKSTITLVNDSVLPSVFQAAEWEAVLSTASKHL